MNREWICKNHIYGACEICPNCVLQPQPPTELESLRTQLSQKDAEIERLKSFCAEWVWGEDNPTEYKSEMTKRDERIAALDAELYKAHSALCSINGQSSRAEQAYFAKRVIQELPLAKELSERNKEKG